MKRSISILLTAVTAVSVVVVSGTSVPGAHASTFASARTSAIGRRWSACESLQWKIHGDLDARSRREVIRAVAQFRRASKLSFEFAGVATDAEWDAPPRNTLVIGVDASLEGSRVAGLTSLWYATTAVVAPSEARTISGARIGVNPQVISGRSATGFPAFLPVVLHELGHVAGLDHVDDPTDLMYPSIVDVRSYRRRDVARLRDAKQNGCAAVEANARR